MPGMSIAITGEGPFLHMWPSHAMKRFPQATIYDRSAAVTAFRQGEVELGRKGLLNAEGQAAAERIARNLANPPEVDATVTFSGSIQNGTIKVKCKNGVEKEFKVKVTGVSDAALEQMFFHVDDAITRCALPASTA